MKVVMVGATGALGGSQQVARQLVSAVAKHPAVQCVSHVEVADIAEAVDADIIHLVRFASSRAEQQVVDWCEEHRKQFVLSTIYWPMHAFATYQKQRAGVSAERAYLEGTEEGMRHERHLAQLLRACAGALPNSYTEQGVIAQMLEGACPPWRVQYNAVEDLFGMAQAPLDPQLKEDLQGAWLYVGRFEDRKNGWLFVEACDELKCKGVVIGHARRERQGRVSFWPPILDRACLAAAMASARFGWQVSLYETPGLAALEMMTVGLPVLVGNQASEREVFGTAAEYANPFDPAAVITGMAQMMTWQPESCQLRNFDVARRARLYRWDDAAAACVDLYREVLAL
jgi:glycosyltransferase involved in cell wall biosynthesis